MSLSIGQVWSSSPILTGGRPSVGVRNRSYFVRNFTIARLACWAMPVQTMLTSDGSDLASISTSFCVHGSNAAAVILPPESFLAVFTARPATAAHRTRNDSPNNRPSNCGTASSTVCPSSSHSLAVEVTACAQSACTGLPARSFVVNAIRSRPGGAPTSWTYGRFGGGAYQRSPVVGPRVASKRAALSRTERATQWHTESPSSLTPGASGLRPRLILSPNNPQHDDGMRIDPPPSLAVAIGTSPAATAAAAPPLEPPGEWAGFQGLRVAPNPRGSVTGSKPNSGVFDLPTMIRPARSIRRITSDVYVATFALNAPEPNVCRTPATGSRSLTRNGTPANGPAGRGCDARFRACSKVRVMIELRAGSYFSIRAMAESTSSSGEIFFCRTSSACPNASSTASSSEPSLDCGSRTAAGAGITLTAARVAAACRNRRRLSGC